VGLVSGPRIIVALDYASERAARSLVEQLDPKLCRLKVGKELFVRAGPGIVEHLTGAGFDVFLDLKFHDIPNTVANACAAAADLGCWMVNVHAGGGLKMMQAASERFAALREAPILIGVTVLTSLDADQLEAIGFKETPEQLVVRLARLTAEAGLAGVVCSPREIGDLRAEHNADFALVTPGIRPPGSSVDDQARIAAPQAAISAGASFLVIGRPITAAEQPLQALLDIRASISGD
jgi:orotidine-5'-phosphate decarboxylase